MSALLKAFFEREGPAATIALLIGALVVASFVFTFVHGIYARFLRPGKNLKKVYGSWGECKVYLFEKVLFDFLFSCVFNSGGYGGN